MQKDKTYSCERLETISGIADCFADRGKAPFLISYSGNETETLSYESLADNVRRLAAGLVVGGLSRGTRVVVMGPTSASWMTAAAACIHAGGVVVPIDAQINDAGLRHILQDSGAAFAFMAQEYAQRISSLDLKRPPRLILLDSEGGNGHWRQLLGDAETALPQAEPEDGVALFYTSGTTGVPKGVPLTHANIACQINTLVRTGMISKQDRIVLPLPLHHVYPFVIGMLGPLAIGATLLVPGALTGPQILRCIQRGQATIMIGVPRLYRALYEGLQAKIASAGRLPAFLLKHAQTLSVRLWTRFRIPLGRILMRPVHRGMGQALRIMACGGASLDPELGRRLEGMGWGVAIGYGLTETSPLLTLRLPGQGPIESVGRPIEKVELRIGSSSEPALAANQHGEILARGPGVFHGYRNLPEETKESFDERGWFRTGDLGWFDDEGNVHVAGRASTMIVTESGENIQPEDVEGAYARDPSIREIGVFARDNKLLALIVPEIPETGDSAGTGVENAVRIAIVDVSKQLPSYMRLVQFRITRDALPMTRLGKIRRHLLADRYDAAVGQGADGAAPRRGPLPYEEMSDADQSLLENETARRVWQRLTIQYPDQSFTPDSSPQFDLGVDSMEWLNLTLEIRERTGAELTEEAISRVHTVRDLLTEAVEASKTAAGKIDPIETPELALSDEQRHWLLPLGPWRSTAALVTYCVVRTLLHSYIRIRTEGRDRVPLHGACVLTPNHTSYLDPFALGFSFSYADARKMYWAGMTTAAFDTPAKRFGCRLGQVVPIDPRVGAMSGLAFAAAVLKRNKRLVWFPEGQRSRDGLLQAFKPGLGLLLKRMPVPVIPVHIEGAYTAWPMDRRWPRPGGVCIRFGRPVDAETLEAEGKGDDATQRIVNAIRNRVASLGTT